MSATSRPYPKFLVIEQTWSFQLFIRSLSVKCGGPVLVWLPLRGHYDPSCELQVLPYGSRDPTLYSKLLATIQQAYDALLLPSSARNLMSILVYIHVILHQCNSAEKDRHNRSRRSWQGLPLCSLESIDHP